MYLKLVLHFYLSCDEPTTVFVDIIKNLLGGKAAKNLDQDIPFFGNLCMYKTWIIAQCA
jgi:hypothetical protein